MTQPKNSRPVRELDVATNAYGRTIYVEEWDDVTRKPKIWYEYNRQDILMKYERRLAGILVTKMGKTKYVKAPVQDR